MRRLVLPVAMVLLAAGCGSAGSPVSPIPPAYQEGRAFPSCTVPVYVAPNVPDRPRVKATADEFGRLSGYRFADSSYADASAHGIVVVWRGGTAPKGGGRANPTYRRSGGRLWTTWRIDLDHVGAVRHEWGHTMGWLHPDPPVAGNLMNSAGTMIHPVQAGQARWLRAESARLNAPGCR